MKRARVWLVLLLLSGCEFYPTPDKDLTQAGRGLPYADSLQAVLNYLEAHPQQADTPLRLHYAAALAYAIGRSATDSAIALIENYLPVSAAHPKICETYLLYNSLAYASIFQGKIDTVAKIVENNIQTLEAMGSCPSALGQAYHLRGIMAYLGGNVDTAVGYYRQAIAYREAAQDLRGLGDSYNNLGVVYKVRGDLDSALAYYQKALQSRIQANDSQGIADSYGNIGEVQIIQGLYPAALDNYLKAASIYEKINDPYSLTLMWVGVGDIYRLQDQPAEARSYLARAIPLQESLRAYFPLAAAYNALANLYYTKENQLDSALIYYQKAVQLNEVLGNGNALIGIYNNIGNILRRKKDFPGAVGYYQKALSLLKEVNIREGIGLLYSNLAETYLGMGQPHIAYSLLLKAKSVSLQSEERQALSVIYRRLSLAESLLARIEQNPARYLAALNYYQQHVALQDSLFNQDNIRLIERLQNQYTYEKKEAAFRAQQEKERLLAEARIHQREMQRNYSIAGLALALLAVGVLLLLLRIIRRQKSTLQAVNAELEIANAELAATNDALEVTNQALSNSNKALEESNKIIHAQKEALEEKNRDILDSITYAKRIQEALLPPADKWQALLPESFVLYLPRDIVAGDFYWMAETEKYIFVGAADATGHGVPGAFVSMICVTTLQKAVHEEGLESPADILMRSKELLTAQLTQYGKRIRDGMDIALLRISKRDPHEIAFSGANRPLWLYTSHEILEIPPTRQPIGFSEAIKPFEEHALTLASGAIIYLFTDGLVDQMGGPKGRKLMQKGLREYLLSIAHLPPAQQGDSIRTFFESWREELPQVDDVTIIGIRPVAT